MNYITRLQTQLKERDEALTKAQNELREFIAHLFTPKFTGVEVDGSRRDWISTRDVLSRLQSIESTLTTVDPL